MDKGSETKYVGGIQLDLLEYFGISQIDAEGAMTGPSVDNKIERLWLDYRVKVVDAVKPILQRLYETNVYQPDDEVDRDLLAGVFLPYISRQSEKFKAYHNSHR